MIDIPRDDLVLMLEAGYIYLAMGKLSEAKQVFEGLIALAPTHDVPVVALGNVLFAQKKYLQAIRVLKDAIDVNPESAFAHAHLGEAYLFYGKRDDASKALAKAVSLDPKGATGEFARSLGALIEQGYDPVKFKEESKKEKASA